MTIIISHGLIFFIKFPKLYFPFLILDKPSSFHDLFIAGDPNNDSPLNVLAANLWKDQPAFKAHLDQHYRENSGKK